MLILSLVIFRAVAMDLLCIVIVIIYEQNGKKLITPVPAFELVLQLVINIPCNLKLLNPQSKPMVGMRSKHSQDRSVVPISRCSHLKY